MVAILAMRYPLGSERDGSLWGSLGIRAALLMLLVVATSGCNGRSCNGPDCDCDGSGDCIISCERDDCELSCSQTSGTCGAVCGDSCEYTCEGAPHCSSYSGTDSQIECRNVSSCAAECGAKCDYSAHDVSSLSLKVGPDSQVDCRNLSSCQVECEGPCTVACTGVSTCSVDCGNIDQTLNNVNGTETIQCD